MTNGFYLITGTSRGIGEALAQVLLGAGHTVLGVSRSDSIALKSDRYQHLSYDLNDPAGIDGIIQRAGEIVDAGDFDFLCLLNNAAPVGPLKAIEDARPEEIESHIQVGLTAPMILTSAFMRKFADHQIRKKVAFISSGAAVRPMPDMSLYCSSKAALKMFADCIGLEQKDREFGFEVVSISPGMVETSMQQMVRSGDHAMAAYFAEAYRNGRVQARETVAKKIAEALSNQYENGEFVSVRDL